MSIGLVVLVAVDLPLAIKHFLVAIVSLGVQKKKKKPTVAQSSAEVECCSMASTAVELTWLSFHLHDLCIPLYRAPLLHCDNLSALHLTVNLVFHGRSKHIELDYHYVRE